MCAGYVSNPKVASRASEKALTEATPLLFEFLPLILDLFSLLLCAEGASFSAIQAFRQLASFFNGVTQIKDITSPHFFMDLVFLRAKLDTVLGPLFCTIIAPK